MKGLILQVSPFLEDMNRILYIIALAVMAASCIGTKTAQCGRHGMLDEKGWYVTKDITPSESDGKVYMISEHGASTCYLVVGRSRAMLIDAGIGVGNLTALVDSLTKLPLIVVNTHGHPDHVGADYQFSEVWMPERDTAVYRSMNPLATPDLMAYVESNAGSFKYEKSVVERNIGDIRNYSPFKIRLFNAGQTWDLGGKIIRTVELGGHTPGSMMFMDDADGILFSGDALNGYLWMWLDHSLPLEEYEKNLAAAIPEIGHLKRIFGGHEFRPEGVEIYQAERMLKDVRTVLAGEIEPVKMPKPLGGEGTVNVYRFGTWLLWAK